MTNSGKTPVPSLLDRLLPRLKYPQLFMVLAGLFLADLLIPDPVPFVDEALLAVLTFLVGSWRTRKAPAEDAPAPPPKQPPKDVTDIGSDGPARSDRGDETGSSGR
jgi:hypothetical protein